MVTPSFGDININSLRNFVAISDIGNITKASEELFITQPTLSRQISQLETTFGVKLLHRNRIGVKLTPEGEIVYNQCRKLLDAYDEFSSTILDLQGMITGTLNIAHQKNIATLILYIHSSFLNAYPNVTINNFRQYEKSYLELLMDEKLHFAYLPTLELSDAPDYIKQITVMTRKNMLLISKSNPLSEKDSIHISELKDESFVLPNKSNAPFLLKQIEDICEENGFSPNVASHAVNFVDYTLDILRFNAVSIHPYMHNVLEDSDQLKYVKLDGFPQDYSISLAWNSNSSHPLIPVYLESIQEFINSNKELIESIANPNSN